MAAVKRSRGRPSTVSIILEQDQLQEKLRLADGKISQVIKSSVRGSQRNTGGKEYKNGGYIPISSQYSDRKVLVIVLDEGVDIK